MDLSTLNEPQREAVECIDKHVRIIAGAGSGKTRVITTRIAYLMEEIHVPPMRILAITFTNKAANEMKNRIRAMQDDKEEAMICTIHSLCVRILREEIRYFGFPQSFTIVDGDDQRTILKQIYKKFNLSNKDFSYSSALAYISDCKMNLVSVKEAMQLANANEKEIDKSKVYEAYQKRLKEMFALDFDDLLLYTFQLFEHSIDARIKWSKRYAFIHVDEFQDVDPIQYGIIKHLCTGDAMLCVVGDPDQTIYTWRGANVDIMLNLPRDFPGCKTIILNQNYRSTPSILKGANQLIRNNKNRLPKDLFTQNADGGKITAYEANSDHEETRWIMRQIQRLHESATYRQIAILYRANYLSRNLEKALIEEHIPYRIYGGIKFFERAEIKDSICYLRLLEDDTEANELAVRRIINSPRRGIGEKTLDRLALIAEEHDIDFYHALKEYPIAKGKVQQEVDKFVALIERYRKMKEERSIYYLLFHLLEDSGYLHMLEENNEDGRMENIQALLSDIEEYEQENDESTLSEYLQMVSIYTDKSDETIDQDFLSLMTAHSAKGLEFDYVFVYEMSEGIFPNERSLNESGNEGLEEERRLAYVAFTRAKKHLYITSSNEFSYMSQTFKRPSRFIDEIEDSVLERLSNKPSPQKREYLYNRGDVRYSNQAESSAYTAKPHKQSDRIRKGDLVEHSIFGEGVVIESDDVVATIAFDQAHGIKKIKIGHPTLKKK